MTITIHQLKSLNACHKLSQSFRSQFGEAIDLPDVWTPFCQAVMLADPVWRQCWGWAVANKLLPSWSMKGWDWPGWDLSRADLYAADLSEANLSRANLSGANLSGANLSEAIGLKHDNA